MEYRIPESPNINYESLVATLESMLLYQREELLRLLATASPFSAYGQKEALQSSNTGYLQGFLRAGNQFEKVNDFGGDNLLAFNFGSRKLIADGKRLTWVPNLDKNSTIPAWLRYAYGEIGTTEIKGPRHNPRVVEYQSVTALKADNDEEAWCGAFVAWCINKAGLPLPAVPERAKDWKNWSSGMIISRPVYGCLVVLERRGGGHVGFAVGKNAKNELLLLGGNQGDQVSIRPTHGQVVGYVWPKDNPTPAFAKFLTRLDTTATAASYR